MANMGSTGTVNITQQMMVDAVQAINDYQSAIDALNKELGDEINSLIPSSFSGSAAQGYKYFYDEKIVPNITTGLSKMLESLISVCDTVKAQIPGDSNGVDDQLGQGNQNSGGAAE